MENNLSIIFAKGQLESLRNLNIIPGENKNDYLNNEDSNGFDNLRNRD